jgi:ABC-type dipeptide/oligopeptide/nickel transport system permease subunit
MIGLDKGNPHSRLGTLLLAGLAAALGGPLLAGGFDLGLHLRQRLQAPSAGHLLGTDALGRDMLSCLACGTLASLAVALIVVALAAGAGLTLGYLAGWHGGRLGAAIMRAADFALAFPGLLLALLLVAAWGPGAVPLITALAAGGWAGTARLVRGEVLKIKEQDFILAARGFNASSRHIATQHVLPLVFPMLLTQAVSGIAAVILAETSLSFLGLGLDPRLPTLGGMIDAGRGYLLDRPALVLIPGACLILLVAGFLLLAEGIRARPRGRAVENQIS